MQKYTRQFICKPNKKSPLKLWELINLEISQNQKNAQSIKSTFCPPCKVVPTSSSTWTCSKQQTISTLSISTATVELWTNSCKNKVPSQKRKPSSSSDKWSKPLKYYHVLISCIETLSLITFYFITETSKSQISAFENPYKTQTIWFKLCQAHQYTWLLKSFGVRSTQTKLIFGHWAWFYIKCCLENVRSKANLQPN